MQVYVSTCRCRVGPILVGPPPQTLRPIHHNPSSQTNPAHASDYSSKLHAPRCHQTHSRAGRRTAPAAAAASPHSSQTPSLTTPVFSTAVSKSPELEFAIDEAATAALSQFKDDTSQPELCIIFVSSAHAAEYERVVGLLREKVPSLKFIVGCSGSGVIGTSPASSRPEEVEDALAVSVALACLPGVDIQLRHVTMAQLPDADAPPDHWATLLGLPPVLPGPLSLVLMADPSFTRLPDLLAGLDYAFPRAAKIGGLSSAGSVNQHRALFCWQQRQQQQQEEGTTPQHETSSANNSDTIGQQGMFRVGACVLALHGGVVMDLLIAQGCRPLTPRTWTIERVLPDGRRVASLASDDGRQRVAPLEALKLDLTSVSYRDEQELQSTLNNLALGLAPSALLKSSLEAHDFLIRALAVDQMGLLLVGDRVRVGQKIRFMVRDKKGAMDDLNNHCLAFKKKQLQASLEGLPLRTPFGMLIFSCNGRGSNLYAEPDYDSTTLSTFIPVPSAGFFCNGEIGQVGDTSHLHGFTCAVGVLRAVPLPEGIAPEGSAVEQDFQ